MLFERWGIFMSFITDLIKKVTKKRLPEPNEVKEQLPLRNIIEKMENSGSIDEFYNQLDKINEEKNLYYPSEVHGLDHTARVTFLSEIMTELDNIDEHTKSLIITSARYHDIGRFDESENKEHGLYGEQILENNKLIQEFSKKDQDIIKFAITQHSKSREENENALKSIPFWKRDKYKIVLSYLKDADALDRVRIANPNMQLDSNRLRNESARSLVNCAKELFNSFPNIYKKYEQTKKNKDFLNNQDEEINIYYQYISNSILNAEYAKEHKEELKILYDKGVLENLKKENILYIDFIENPKMTYAVSQIEKNDFETIKNSGYNITYKTFLNVVSMYKPGTIEQIRKNGEIGSIFSLESFKKYGKEQDFNERLNNPDISPNELYQKVSQRTDTSLLKGTFDRDFLLYKDLYQNNKVGFDTLKFKRNTI